MKIYSIGFARHCVFTQPRPEADIDTQLMRLRVLLQLSGIIVIMTTILAVGQ
jgi:hypothetical protein